MRRLPLVLIALLAGTLAASPGLDPLGGFASAVSSMKSYHTTVHVHETKGSESRNSVFDYTFEKPNSISMSIRSGPNAGSAVSWSGGDSVTARKSSGMASMFKKTVSLKDPLVTSLRGYTIVDLSFPAILKHAQATKGEMSVASAKLGEKSVESYTLTVADPATDDGMTREVLYLDPKSQLPLRIDGFAGSTLVRSYSFDDTTVKG